MGGLALSETAIRQPKLAKKYAGPPSAMIAAHNENPAQAGTATLGDHMSHTHAKPRTTPNAANSSPGSTEYG